MSLSINCQISLSKKLRNLIEGKECTINLSSSELVDGKGLGRLSIVTESEISNQIDMTETNISIIPIDVADEMPESHAVGSIFTTDVPKKVTSKSGRVSRTAVDRIAVTEPPEKHEVPYAIVSKEEIKTPKEFKEMKSPRCQRYIKDISELLEAAEKASNKNVDIDIGKASNDRERALLIEQRNRGSSIGIPAYIVNDKAGALTINDLDLVLHLNAPFNLANISGKKIAESGQLRGLLRAGIVRFISPEEAQNYMNKLDEEIIKAPSLDVFDNRRQAEAAIMRDDEVYHNSDVMDLTMEDLESPTQEESLIIDLTANTGSSGEIIREGNKKSVHGSTHSNIKKNIPTVTNLVEPNKNPAHRTVRKLQ